MSWFYRELTDKNGPKEVMELLDALENGYGFSPGWFQFDPATVRGLSYYTGVVFEGFDKKREFRAICGGGRYDTLFQSMSQGELSIPAVGFGFGDAVILELLKSKELLPNFESSGYNHLDVVVYSMEESLTNVSRLVASQLRKEGFRVELLLDKDRKLKYALQMADKSQARILIILAHNECSQGKLIIKDMTRREQFVVESGDCVSWVRNILRADDAELITRKSN